MLNTTSVTSVNPYPGLRPYQPNEQTKFYGRQEDTQALLTKILSQRLTLLFAATGVGKSSLLQAAILPQLKAKPGLNLDVVYYNDWVAPPLKGLQQAIRQALVKPEVNLPDTPQNLSLEAFFRFIAPSTSQPLVIILDQFEEFFRYRFIHHAADFQPFIDQLAEVILAPELPVSLVFSMREDFALELNAFKPHLPNPLFSNYYRLEKLGIDAAKAAITEPLLQSGYHYEPALLDELLKDLLSRDLTRDASSLAKGTQADSVEPPYLQIVCSQLWELDKNDPQKTLRLATYQQAGGAKGLLENYVNYVLKSFSDREKQVTSKAFDHLISRRGTKMAHTPEDLAELVNLKPAELANSMDKLEKARILRRQQRDQQVWYELYHDMFSGGIEAWNTAWKNHMRLRRTLIATAASLAALAAIYFGVVGYLQATSKHLRLGNSSNDRVEIYTGSSKFPDPFGQQHYLSETGFERNQLELDKRYPKRDIPDYPLTVRDLIASQPLENRIRAYIDNGEFCQFSDLLTQVVNIEQAAPGCQLNRQLSPALPPLQGAETRSLSATTNPELDSMMSTMLMHLTEMKTAWGFEQLSSLSKAFEHNPSGLPLPDTLPFYAQPLNYSPEELLNQGLLRRSFSYLDPRFLEVSLNWVLNPEQFQVEPLMRPIELVNTLVETGSAANSTLLYQVMQTMQLKPRLLNALSSSNAQTKEAAVILIGQTKDANFAAPLSKLLLDKTPSIRQAALKSLFQIAPEQALATSASLITDRHQPLEIRSALILALGNSNSLKAAPLLLARVQDPNEREDIRQNSAFALGNLGITEAIPTFRALIKDQNERTEARIGAIEGLRSLNDRDSIDLLLNRLQDPEERIDIRSTCATALGVLTANQAVGTLLDLIEQPSTDENLKYAALSALAELEDPNIVPRLSAYLKTLPATSNLVMQLAFILDGLIKPWDSSGFTSPAYSSLTGATNQQLLLDLGVAVTTPQYQAMHQTRANIDPNVNSLLTGSYSQRQALLTALNLSDANRNPALVRIALDSGISTNIRAQALIALEPSIPQAAEIGQALIPLTQDPSKLIRQQSTNALLRLLEGEALLPWLKASNLPNLRLASGLERYVSTSPRPQAISTLLSLADDDKSPLQATAYKLLAELQAMEALPLLQSRLARLEEESHLWRQQRDQQPADLSDVQAYRAWQARFEAAKPQHAFLAIYYGYALAQMGLEQAINALRHDLADVRLGASLSLGKYASVEDLSTIAEERLKHPAEPLFQQASYQALNQGLGRLELTTNPEHIQALETWQTQNQALDKDPVTQRLTWTLTMIKHYQSIDQAFAKKYQLQRSL
ncbi:MAG: hypothetical protein E6Q83_10515 [Thiothrix sp.]|nr:MAG: hypothetical protein E6Q83_10515 [Thiothrix sp.]